MINNNIKMITVVNDNKNDDDNKDEGIIMKIIIIMLIEIYMIEMWQKW